LEQLEQAVHVQEALPVVWVTFGTQPTSIHCHGEALGRLPGESVEAFKARALIHFEPTRLPQCALVLWIGDLPKNPIAAERRRAIQKAGGR
jgi:hypothetical protein